MDGIEDHQSLLPKGLKLDAQGMCWKWATELHQTS
jgi:hypothetical protein